MNSGVKESLWVQVVKVILLSASAVGYTWELLHGAYHIVAVVAVIVAAICAAFATKWRVRTLWCVLVSCILIVIGFIGSTLTLNNLGAYDLASTINVSRIWYYSGIIFGIVFLTRSLSLRYRTAQSIESALIIGTLVYNFFDHRDFNLQNPREFADYLYTHGYDPINVYRGMGVIAAFLSILMLLGNAKAGRVAYSIVVLLILALLGAWLIENTRIPADVRDPLGLFDNNDNEDGGKDGDEESKGDQSDDNDDDNDDNDDDGEGGNGGGDDKKDGNGGGKGNNDSNSPNPNSPPTPVAVAVFYDEFTPNDGIFHFRQTVLSEYDGNHLVASTVDDDVISTLSTSQALEAAHVQNENLHAKVSTSMFLMKEQQPPQLAMGQKVFPIQNPDPKVFVSAYGVESVGLTMELTRLIGRHSIPAEWSSEKVEHYLEIPDDPRYQALSDIIVRQIDPRFIGDDIVKALYIKTWLEKNGYYTMKTKHIDAKDPTASFLFGSLRGYCVHFAHSAVYLLRSQGIAARVAVGYAVDNQMRGTGSAVLILGSMAHAWPEIYVDGIGWVTLEIFPENGDEPPAAFVDQSLESLFGELARDDKSGGKAEMPQDSTFEMPWNAIWNTLLALLMLAFLACYVRKIAIILGARNSTQTDEIYRLLRCAIMYWSMFGHSWRPYHSIMTFAEKTAGSESATYALTELADAAKLGAELDTEDVKKAHDLLAKAIEEAKNHTPAWRRFLGYINPIVRL